MTAETTIPCLPCRSLDDTLAFYRALGFAVSHSQTRPNLYAALHRGGLHLHFFGLKGLDPAAAFSTCLAIVPEVEALHQTFAAALRQHCGKLPTTGVPRITRMKPGQSRFTVVDPDGNSIIFIRRDAPDDYDEGDRDPGDESALEQARRTALRLRDFRNDDAAAATVLDAALRRATPSPPLDRARAVAARAELALVLGDPARADLLRAELATLIAQLDPADLARHTDELTAADRLAPS